MYNITCSTLYNIFNMKKVYISDMKEFILMNFFVYTCIRRTAVSFKKIVYIISKKSIINFLLKIKNNKDINE